MFKKITITSVALLLLSLTAKAQPADSINLGKDVKMKIGGFIRNDFLFDSRKNEGNVDGLFDYFPKPKDLDANGEDLNAVPTSNLYALSTRFGAFFSGPDALNAKSTAALEFDFTGTTGVNGVRLRQAWMKLNWGKTDLLVGRTWHPMSNVCMPNVVSLGSGAPFFSFNRAEQIRFNYRFGRMQLSTTALFRTPEYMRQSLVPELNVQLAYSHNGLTFGASGDYFNIRPKTYTQVGTARYETNERVSAPSAHVFVAYQKKNLIVKASSIYGQMLNDITMMGGYAAYDIDPATGHESYVPSQHLSSWVNVVYGTKWQAGLFLGYIDNLGYSENPTTISASTRGADIASMYRVAPSITFNAKRLMLACELEYTSAAYGAPDFADKGKVINTNNVGNVRLNLAAAFLF